MQPLSHALKQTLGQQQSIYLNDQLILQGHLKLFQECHPLCLGLRIYQLRCRQQYLNIGSVFLMS